MEKIKGNKNCINSVAFSLDGKLIASGGADKIIRIFNTNDYNEEKQLIGNKDCISTIAFSPDSKKILSGGGDCILRLFDLEINTFE